MRLQNDYLNEQEQIKKDLLDILNLEDKQSFVLYELDNNEEMKSKTLSLLPQINTYYSKKPASITSPDKTKRHYYSIIRFVLNDYEILSVDYWMKIGDNNVKTKKIHLVKK